MNIEVINGYKLGWNHSTTIYIGRENPTLKFKASPLANPYVIGKDGNREECIAKYRSWLWKQIKDNNPDVIAELDRIAATPRAKLACYCKPYSCHGDVIASCITWYKKRPKGETFGDCILNARRSKGLSQRELAEKLSIDFKFLSKLESNRVKPESELLPHGITSEELISQLAHHLNLEFNHLQQLANQNL